MELDGATERDGRNCLEWTVWNGDVGSYGVTLNFREQYVVVDGTGGSWRGFRSYRWGKLKTAV